MDMATLQATLAPKSASSGNETVATVTANANAANVSHDLIVTALAEGVQRLEPGESGERNRPEAPGVDR